MSDIKVKTVHLAVGVDLIGSKTSLQGGRNYELTANAIGIRALSKATGRVIFIPYTNVKAFEQMPDEVAPKTAKESKKV